MKYILMIIQLLFLTTSFGAELSCSKNGTEVFYINGINVSLKENERTRKIISDTLELVKIDNKAVSVTGIHNISTSFIGDIRETKNMLLANVYGQSRVEYYESILREELGLNRVRVEEVGKKYSTNELKFEKISKELRQQFKKYRISTADDYKKLSTIASAAKEVSVLENIGLLKFNIAHLIKFAAADELVVNRVIFKLVDSLKNNSKVIIVAHSQGNEVLRSAVNEIRRNPVGEGRFSSREEFETKFNEVFGTVQVAPPSPQLIFCTNDPNNTYCKSSLIKIDEDLVINTGNLIMSALLRSEDYQLPAVAPNYILESNNQILIDSIIPIFGVARYALFLANTSGAHGMDDLYLNSNYSAISTRGGSAKAMNNIFNDATLDVAKALKNNCDLKITHDYAQCEIHMNAERGYFSYFGRTYSLIYKVEGRIPERGISNCTISTGKMVCDYIGSDISFVDIYGNIVFSESVPNPCVKDMSLPPNGRISF